MFQFLDHPSETLVEVSGASLQDVFRDAAAALFEVMTDTSRVRKEIVVPVSLTAASREILLIEWLNRLIVIHEVESLFLAHFEIRVIEGARPAGNWSLEALAGGERIGENHEKRSHVKSATFGSFEWIESRSGHVVRFVLDI